MHTRPSGSKQPSILIIDDIRTMRRMGRDVLEQEGLHVREAEDGAAGLRMFAERPPDLVLLDVHMPDLDGFTVCEEIRRLPGGADTPILMITSREDIESIRRAFEAGATDFTTKPVNWEIIRQRIRYMLRMNQALADLRTSESRLSKAQHIAHLGSWELDLGTGVVVLSEELARLYGLPFETREIDHRAILDRIHEEDRGMVRDLARRAAQEGSTLSVDHRILGDGEDARTLHLQADPVLDADGRAIELWGTAQDVTERKRADDQIRFLAYHDSLTRLGNRRMFAEQLRYALARSRRDEAIVAVLFLDLDHFKRINDTLGHSSGDQFLETVAERLRSSVRDCDCVSRAVRDESVPTLSRFGGDEFMIALSNVENRAAAGQVAARILEDLSRPFQVEGQNVVVTASIGISLAPEDGEDAETLIRNADAAMYHAKETGRASCKFYKQSLNAVAHRALRVENELRAALDHGDLELHYQPKIEVLSGAVVGFEALVRWQHPELGMIPPDKFVPVAERSGLIDRLGEFVLRSACTQAKAWRQAGLPPIRVGVNFSPYQFHSYDVAESVMRVVREVPISPRQLDVEITESAMMQNKAITVAVLEKLKGAGITISLDDFGTGYSSLSYLKGFPVDTVKIDRSFVREISTDPDDAALTAAIISMAKALSLKVVAEGVETEDQLEFLRAHGCQEVQGYLFSRPLPADEATAFLRQNLSDVDRERGGNPDS